MALTVSYVAADLQIQTPLDEAKRLSAASENRILLKREDMQPVFSFKLRGAYNKVRLMSACFISFFSKTVSLCLALSCEGRTTR